MVATHYEEHLNPLVDRNLHAYTILHTKDAPNRTVSCSKRTKDMSTVSYACNKDKYAFRCINKIFNGHKKYHFMINFYSLEIDNRKS